jgi:Putative bacterial sensory transduction regulator
MRITKLATILIATVAASSQSGMAAPPATPPAVAKIEMITAQNPQSVVKALQDAGYRAEVTKDGDGDPLINSSTSGYNFGIYFFGCEKNVSCTSIQFFAGFAKTGADLAKVNKWNNEKRFGRAALDKDGGPVIRMDVDLDFGGMSAPLFKDHLNFWDAVMSRFAEEMSSKE